MQQKIKYAQVIVGGQGDSVVVVDGLGNIFVFAGPCASQLREEYERQLRTRAGKFSLRFQVDVEVEEPIGRRL
jgi:hypothetical protein